MTYRPLGMCMAHILHATDMGGYSMKWMPSHEIELAEPSNPARFSAVYMFARQCKPSGEKLRIIATSFTFGLGFCEEKSLWAGPARDGTKQGWQQQSGI